MEFGKITGMRGINVLAVHETVYSKHDILQSLAELVRYWSEIYLIPHGRTHMHTFAGTWGYKSAELMILNCTSDTNAQQ